MTKNFCRPAMNINLLKTFLEVARLRHFGKTADRLCLTQSAVSARIKQIEDALGVTLFDRKRNDIKLTAEGRRLARAADKIVKQWELAKNEITMASNEGQELVRIGIVYDTWSILSSDWLQLNRQNHPDLLFQVQAFSAPLLQERLLADEVDAAVMFDPPYHPGFHVIDLGHIELQLLSTRKTSLDDCADLDYVYVDWGEGFSGLHQQHLGDILMPAVSMNISAMAIDHLLHYDGMAYLPMQQIIYQNASKHFYEVVDAPIFQRGICYAYRKTHGFADLLQHLGPSLN
jgi:DNA-binding transcriptional LysR family regulator